MYACVHKFCLLEVKSWLCHCSIYFKYWIDLPY